MTEKDFQRIEKYDLNEIKYLKLELKIIEEEKFLNEILNLYA